MRASLFMALTLLLARPDLILISTSWANGLRENQSLSHMKESRTLLFSKAQWHLPNGLLRRIFVTIKVFKFCRLNLPEFKLPHFGMCYSTLKRLSEW